MNRDMMRMFGISHTTMQRFKRELGLQKNMRTIRRKQAQVVKRICEQNGYYDSLRGKAPCQAARDATRLLRANGFHPLRQIKKNNPRKYRRLLEKRSKAQKEIWRKEKLRVEVGLQQRTRLYVPYFNYGRRRCSFRNSCKSVGYIPGDAYDPDERWIIYYNENTCRGAIREQHGEALGFKFVQK